MHVTNVYTKESLESVSSALSSNENIRFNVIQGVVEKQRAGLGRFSERLPHKDQRGTSDVKICARHRMADH